MPTEAVGILYRGDMMKKEMKLYEFTRYNPMDDEMVQTLIFAPSKDEAFEELYGYPVPAGDHRRGWWEVTTHTIKKGELKLTLF